MGGAVHTLVDGVRAVKRSVSVTADDQWHVGSITKSMTATLIATAVDAGELAWEDTVGEILGPTVPGLSELARSVTLLQLLSHRAGLAANLPDSQLSGFAPTLADARDERRRFAADALAQPLAGKPGETFLYSNNGYVVAGAMLEARLGTSWETLMVERLFGPLGMRTAGFGAPGHAGQLDQPVGHRAGPLPFLFKDARRAAEPGSQELTDNVAAMGPAGRVHLSMPDLIRYLEAHRQRSALLSPGSWAKLHTPPFGGNYALGWEVQPDGSLWHNGSNTLWYAEVKISSRASACAVSNDGVLSSAVPAVSAVLSGAMVAAES
jgi:CubicO group peptidase (beta-lactamase class C family)